MQDNLGVEIPETPEKYIDMDEALKRVGGSKAIYKRLLGMFLKSKEFESLEDSLAQQDYEKAEAFAHSIKGLTGNLSLIRLFETSTKLMHELREGACGEDTLKDYRDAYEKTRVEVEKVIDSIS